MQCKTGSKILTEPEPDRIGIIWLKKLTGFDRIGRIFTEFKKNFLTQLTSHKYKYGSFVL